MTCSCPCTDDARGARENATTSTSIVAVDLELSKLSIVLITPQTEWTVRPVKRLRPFPQFSRMPGDIATKVPRPPAAGTFQGPRSRTVLLLIAAIQPCHPVLHGEMRAVASWLLLLSLAVRLQLQYSWS